MLLTIRWWLSYDHLIIIWWSATEHLRRDWLLLICNWSTNKQTKKIKQKINKQTNKFEYDDHVISCDYHKMIILCSNKQTNLNMMIMWLSSDHLIIIWWSIDNLIFFIWSWVYHQEIVRFLSNDHYIIITWLLDEHVIIFTWYSHDLHMIIWEQENYQEMILRSNNLSY